MLAMLGWNDGSGQEIFTLDELVHKFDISRVHKGGAKFDFEKAKWFNNQYIQRMDNQLLAELAEPYIVEHGYTPAHDYMVRVVALVKERCTLLPDFWTQGHFFFETPELKELQAIKDKWTEAKQHFFAAWIGGLNDITWEDALIETSFNELAAAHGIKKGELMLPLRIMLVGGKYGPGVFHIAGMIGMDETIKRVAAALAKLA